MFSEQEANRKFCKFIRDGFGLNPMPITPDELSRIAKKRVAVLVHNPDQAKALGYTSLWAFGEDHRIFAPFYDYDLDEAFDEFDSASFNSDANITYLSSYIQSEELDEEWVLRDIREYNEVYYVTNEIIELVGIDELI